MSTSAFIRFLTSVQPDPAQWAPALVDLLQALEVQAQQLDPDHPAGFELALERLQDAISDRLTGHQWK